MCTSLWEKVAHPVVGISESEIVGEPIERTVPEDAVEQGRLWAHLAEARRKGAAAATAPRLTAAGAVVQVACATTWLAESDVFVCVMRRAE